MRIVEYAPLKTFIDAASALAQTSVELKGNKPGIDSNSLASNISTFSTAVDALQEKQRFKTVRFEFKIQKFKSQVCCSSCCLIQSD